MLLAINPQNPQPRLIQRAVEVLRQGGVIAYPTDTVYGLGCDIFSSKGLQRIYRAKERDAKKPFSFICADIADATDYAQISNFAFRIMKRHLPGPYTFILEATRRAPALVTTKKKTVGIRIPNHPIALALVRELGHPLITTSANLADHQPIGDPQEIDEILGAALDLVIDGGILTGEPSTVISLVGDQIEVLRQGCGDTSWITER